MLTLVDKVAEFKNMDRTWIEHGWNMVADAPIPSPESAKTPAPQGIRSILITEWAILKTWMGRGGGAYSVCGRPVEERAESLFKLCSVPACWGYRKFRASLAVHQG
jgi:hypothetical protein